MTTQNNQFGYQGTQTVDSSATGFNAISFISNSLINAMATITPVKVMSVTNSGGLSPVGMVDLQPLVNQVDGFGNAIPHSVIHNCPYFRLQGGANAIILDPQVGDTGIALFCDKDISKVVAAQLENSGATSSPANPDSGRRFSFSDGLYLGGILNGTPTQYIQYSTSGINITSPVAISLNAPDINLNAQTIELNGSTSVTITTPTFTINGATQMNGTLNTSSTIVAATSVTSPLVTGTTNVVFGGKSGIAHTHSGVTIGGGNTGAPN